MNTGASGVLLVSGSLRPAEMGCVDALKTRAKLSVDGEQVTHGPSHQRLKYCTRPKSVESLMLSLAQKGNPAHLR